MTPGLKLSRQAAEHLNVAEQTLRAWRLRGHGPRFIKLGRSIRYDPQDLDDWVASNRRTSTSDRGEAA